MIEVRLPRGVWHYDPDKALGPPGGFGAVFFGVDGTGAPVAVKRLHVQAAQAAHREMDIADHLVGKQFRHVMSVLDVGLDADSDAYFVVMPKAERSLADEIVQQGRLCDLDTSTILIQIAKGLAEIPELAHRDLKPGNILMHEEAWKIADFGIARFVESVTSHQTLKGCLSPEYAAPEQWRFERATTATDVYALGCIAHALLRGTPPFDGTADELHEKHVSQEPPKLDGCRPRLQSLISMLLRKTPCTRPSVQRIITILDAICAESDDTPAPSGLRALAGAGAAIAQSESVEEAKRAEEQERLNERRRVANEGKTILEAMRDRCFAKVVQHAPSATINRQDSTISMARASLQILLFPEVISPDSFPNKKWDVIAAGIIGVLQKEPERAESASLFYADGGGRSDLRWYELAFKTHPLMRERRRFEPFGLRAQELRQADLAMWTGMHTVELAAQPCTIDDEDETGFIDRWASVFARAAEGRLG